MLSNNESNGLSLCHILPIRSRDPITTQGGNYLGSCTLKRWNLIFTMARTTKSQTRWKPIFPKEPFRR